MTTDDRSFEMSPETKWRPGVMETHLVNREDGTESPFCGVEASDDECIGVGYYLRARNARISVGTICEACKAQAMPFAVNEARELQDEGRLDEAEEYWQLAETLARETGQNPPCR